MSNTVKEANSLISEKSPYLRQHAYNPVKWLPWSEEAFKKAADEDKPVFISIGYSSCHWCHVMKKESFEDEETARLINETFIPVKVDREERPAVDDFYMNACQIMTGHGGWPLTIFAAADKQPFFAATYLPKDSAGRRMGLTEIILKVRELWQNDRIKLAGSANEIMQILGKASKVSQNKLDPGIMDKAFSDLYNIFDEHYGGFGTAPKFPMFHQLLFLLHYSARSGNKKAEYIAEKTLLAIRGGGIFDQVGYGLHRYSTDKKWQIPHFEKMLYDQAMGIYAYAEAFQAAGRNVYGDIAAEIARYVQREMRSPEGGFYSSQDADTEGEEGAFYKWTAEEVRAAVSAKESGELIKIFNIKEGKSLPCPAVSEEKNIREIMRYKGLIRRLYEKRSSRQKPDKDKKILTDRNGLMIAALAKAAFVLNDGKLLKMAEDAAEYIFKNLFGNGSLLHCFRTEKEAIEGFLDDYAFLIWGLIELYEATFNTEYIERALNLMIAQFEKFWDEESGGFFLSSLNAEELPVRRKEIYDGALPSGNSASLWNLVRLAHLTDNIEFEKKAGEMIKIFSDAANKNPSAFCQFLIGINALRGPFSTLVIAGKKGGRDTEKLLDALRKKYQPAKVVLFKPEKERIPEILNFMEMYEEIDGKATAYICGDTGCSKPATDAEELLKQL